MVISLMGNDRGLPTTICWSETLNAWPNVPLAASEVFSVIVNEGSVLNPRLINLLIIDDDIILFKKINRLYII